MAFSDFEQLAGDLDERSREHIREPDAELGVGELEPPERVEVVESSARGTGRLNVLAQQVDELADREPTDPLIRGEVLAATEAPEADDQVHDERVEPAIASGIPGRPLDHRTITHGVEPCREVGSVDQRPIRVDAREVHLMVVEHRHLDEMAVVVDDTATMLGLCVHHHDPPRLGEPRQIGAAPCARAVARDDELVVVAVLVGLVRRACGGADGDEPDHVRRGRGPGGELVDPSAIRGQVHPASSISLRRCVR
jgi:hypothetical protein